MRNSVLVPMRHLHRFGATIYANSFSIHSNKHTQHKCRHDELGNRHAI